MCLYIRFSAETWTPYPILGFKFCSLDARYAVCNYGIVLDGETVISIFVRMSTYILQKVYERFRREGNDRMMSILRNVLGDPQHAEMRKALQFCVQPWEEIIELQYICYQRACRLVTVQFNLLSLKFRVQIMFLPCLWQNCFQLIK